MKVKSSRISDYKMLYISNWNELEVEARNRLLSLGVKETNSIRTLFEELKKNNILNDQDLNTVLTLLRMRNEIVHGDKIEYDNDLLRYSLGKLDELIKKVH
jgi:uncharacterized protein YutE (UPF0331/DUF86 family)